MHIAVPKEIKNHEYRVAMVPAGVHSLVEDGHTVLIQARAGEGSGISDTEYQAAGAEIRATAEEVLKAAQHLVRQAVECRHDAHGRERDAARGHGEPMFVVQDPQRLHRVLVVVERFAHPHQHQIERLGE